MSTPSADGDRIHTALRTSSAWYEPGDDVLSVRGADRATWLAGMVTADVKTLPTGASRYAAVVTVKGRFLADAWIHAAQDEILVMVPAGRGGPVREHFERHVIMEDVELVPDAARCVLCVQGPGAAQSLSALGLTGWPEPRLGPDGFSVLLDVGARDVVRSRLADAGVLRADATALESLRIERGVPRYGVDFGEENFVQEAGITSRAVSFQKGCYVGQEVVCRLQMRGHVRKQLVGLHVDGPPPAPGSALEGGVGSITSSAPAPDADGSVAIAMVSYEFARHPVPVSVGGAVARVTHTASE